MVARISRCPSGSAVAGAAAAVVISFLALGLLWRQPRLHGTTAGRPLPRLQRALDGRAGRAATRLLAVLIGVYLLVTLTGRDTADNPLPWLVYVYLWVGLVPVSALLGPIWRRLNPVRALHAGLMAAARLDPAEGLYRLPDRVGLWPAAVGLFCFTWLELVAPDNAELGTLRWAAAVFVGVHLLAALLFGDGWFDRADPFEVWSAMFGRFSPLGRRDDGMLVLRPPLAGPDALPPAPGLVAVVTVMIGSTAYDGLSGSPGWAAYVQSSTLPTLLLPTAGLLGVTLLLAGLYIGCTWFAGRVAGVPRGEHGESIPTAFAHSVLPVALGYVVAHYYTLLALEGQRGLTRIGDPRGTGADLLGLADLRVNPAPVDPNLAAAVQVLAIVIGHVVGVVLAHDRAVRLFPRRAAVLGQLPLLVLMVTLTCTALLLLLA